VTEPPINIHIHSTLSPRQRRQLVNAITKGETMTKPTLPRTFKAEPQKPGYQTTEFWVTILTALGASAAAASNNLPDRYAALATTISVVAYSISRGLAKH